MANNRSARPAAGMDGVPTVELHRHFEAGMSPEHIALLAQRNNVTGCRGKSGAAISDVDPQDPDSILRYYRRKRHLLSGTSGFAIFVESFGVPLSVLTRPEDLEWAAFRQLIEQRESGSLHTELRGSPYSYLPRVGGSIVEVIQAIVNGIERARSEHGASGSAIVCFSRQNGEQATGVVEAVLRLFNRDSPVGIDIARAPEHMYPPRDPSLG